MSRAQIDPCARAHNSVDDVEVVVIACLTATFSVRNESVVDVHIHFDGGRRNPRHVGNSGPRVEVLHGVPCGITNLAIAKVQLNGLFVSSTFVVCYVETNWRNKVQANFVYFCRGSVTLISGCNITRLVNKAYRFREPVVDGLNAAASAVGNFYIFKGFQSLIVDEDVAELFNWSLRYGNSTVEKLDRFAVIVCAVLSVQIGDVATDAMFTVENWNRNTLC